MQKHIDQLEAVQRRAARFALGDYRSTSSVSDMLAKLQWPTLQDRRKNGRLTMISKILNNTVAVCANLNPLPQRLRRGHDQQLRLIQCRTKYRQNSFFPRTITEWNALPQNDMESFLHCTRQQ